MLPLLTFVSGIVAGAAGVRILKSKPGAWRDRAHQRFDRTRSGLREAAVSGLSAVEKTSAGLREKLEAPPPSAAAKAGTETAS